MGNFHALALSSDGKTYAWGANDVGQLGDGTTIDQFSPVEVHTPDGVRFVEVVAGDLASFALGSDGVWYAWGDNASGQLGDGTSTNRAAPVPIALPVGVTITKVVSDTFHSLALDTDGNIYSWGQNQENQLGLPGVREQLTPARIPVAVGLTFTDIETNRDQSLAIGSDGNTYAWGGGNSTGGGSPIIGDGTSNYRESPVTIDTSGTPDVIPSRAIAAGGNFSMAIGSDGMGYTWGLGNYGSIGNGALRRKASPTPMTMPTGVTFRQIAAGWATGYALGSDDQLYAWGLNSNGQVGDGSTSNRTTPVVVSPLSGVTFTEISASEYAAAALGNDGQIYTWGVNDFGQLGNAGNAQNRAEPMPVMLPEPVVTGVTFDGVAGTDLVENGDGTVTVTAPPHAPGPVDVTVEWSLDGTAQPAVNYSAGYTYLAALSLTDPEDRSVAVGDTATFETVMTGGSTPVIHWEVSTDGGHTWEPADDASEVSSADGSRLTVTPPSTDFSGRLYRAVAVDPTETFTTQTARLVVTFDARGGGIPRGNPGTSTPTSSPTGSPTGAELARTGSEDIVTGGLAAASALALGGFVILMRCRAQRSVRVG